MDTNKNYISNTIQITGIPTRDQGKTGRCWLEAALSELEYLYYKKTGERLPKLSSVFLGYYDLKWKVHIFLMKIEKTRHLTIDDPLIDYWLKKPIQDAGQYSVFMELVKKHGVVPESVMSRTNYSFDTRTMISGINQKLRRESFLIREGSRSAEEAEKEIYLLIERCMGTMPDYFEYEGRELKPEFFFNEIIWPQISWEGISFVNCPTPYRPFGYSYKVKWLYSETEESSPIDYYNVDEILFTSMVIEQLRRGYPIWIGVDAEHHVDKDAGIFDLFTQRYTETENIEMELDKGSALLYRDSLMTHALLLCGVDMQNEKVTRWCAKNSFGEKTGQNGYAIMSPEWFGRYVYQAIIRKEIAAEFIKPDNYEKSRVRYLEAWDPFGCLA